MALSQMEPKNEIVKSAGLAKPVESTEKLAAYFNEYVKLCQEIVKPEDKQKIIVRVDGKEQEKYFTKKSGWRKLATAYCISTREGRREQRVDREDGSFVIESHVIAYSPVTNREVEGIGKCDSKELPGGDKKLEHDVSAKAYTRASNRAISDFIGSGESSAEEMEPEESDKISSAKKVGSKTAEEPQKSEDAFSAEYYLDRLNWFTREGTKNRAWKAGDSWGWANVTLFNGEGIAEYAAAIVHAIEDSGKDSVEVGVEEISYDKPRGRLTRKKVGASIPTL